MQELSSKIKSFFRQKRWRKIKKTDWAVIALTGVLLMIIAMPTGEKKQGGGTVLPKETTEEKVAEKTKTVQKDDYISNLENRLEEVLSQIEGVGKVSVMITVSDNGTCVVEKDTTKNISATEEKDGSGGNRAVKEEETEENTIYIENGQEKTPYIQKETLPTIEGIVVVAEGGENGKTISDISEAIEALFSVEAHRIKVVKMGSKEG